MSASQAPHRTQGRSLDSPRQKSPGEIGWLSHGSYKDLPPRFQLAARTLQELGELIIEGIP